MTKFVLRQLFVLSLLAPSVACSAIVVVRNSTNTFSVSDVDLLQLPGTSCDASLLHINVPESAGYGTPSLTDGLFPTNDRALAIAEGTLTYSLDTSVATNGYDITRIVTYGGWANWARSQQKYSLAYADVHNPSDFVDMVVDVDSGYYPPDRPSYTAVSITHIIGAPLATGVAALRFTFPEQLHGGAGYREFDLFGVPSSSLQAADVAASIRALTTPMRGSTNLVFPAVPPGFQLAVRSSSHPAIVTAGGTINPPLTNTVVQLVLAVTHTESGVTEDTQPITLLVPASSLQTPFVSYTENFSMRRGLFIHWSAPPDGRNNPIVFSDGSRSSTIDQFTESVDVPAVVSQIAALDFEYVIITDFHGYQTTLHPCAAVDSWRGSGCTSTRDLMGEMIAGLKAQGIRVYLFTHPLDGVNGYTPEQQALVGWFDPAYKYRRWNDYLNDVYAELVERYGDDIAGIGFDSEFGMVVPQTRGKLDLKRLRNTVLSRRPQLSLHGLAGPNDTVELGIREIWRPSWLDPWGSRSETDYDVETWPAYRRVVAIAQGYHWATILTPEQGMARLTGTQMFRYSVLQAGVATEGPGVAWAVSPYTDGTWEDGVGSAFVNLEALEEPIRESLRGVLPSRSYSRDEGVWISTLPQGVVATRRADDTVEYLHVLNPPAGDTLALPLPEDGKRFTSASLLSNGHIVQLVTHGSGVNLTLGVGDTWNTDDTVIKLLVDPESLPPRNLALHKPVAASSSVQDGPRWGTTTPWGRIRLVDGQTAAVTATNGWSAGNYGYSSVPAASNCCEWVSVDLETVHWVNTVRMHPRNDGDNLGYGFPVDFEILTSLDDTNWLSAVSLSEQTRPSTPQTYAFSTRAARYVQLAASQLRANPNENGDYSFQLAELEVLGFSILPALMGHRTQESLVLEWDNGLLQSTDDLNDGFTDVPGASSPCIIYFSTNDPRRFFRLRF